MADDLGRSEVPSMTPMVIAYVIIALVMWPLTSGMEFSELQATEQCQHVRRHAGIAMLHGGLLAAFWPLGLPIALGVTGFAEHGVWQTKCWP